MAPKLSYLIDVIGLDVADVAAAAGGWLFDRVMDGWTATVLVSGEVDERALRIIGAQAQRVDALPGLTTRRPEALAVSAAVLRAVPQVREHVEQLLEIGDTEVRVWGGQTADGRPLRHRLSTAARAFKAQALLAAGGGGRITDSEDFHRVLAAGAGRLEVVS